MARKGRMKSNQLISVMNTDIIKVVTGVRRCGKSYLLLELFRQYLLDNGVDEKHIIVMDLEDRRNKMYRDPDHLLEFIDHRIQDERFR